MKELKIVIAEDFEMLSRLLRLTLSKVEGFNVVGVAADGVRAISMVRELDPHVLILDISLPLKGGIEALEEIRATDSSTLIVMFTAEQSPIIRKVCLDAGANYFLDKSQIAELIEICSLHRLAL
ncbi:MAG TPA: response regulator transcription factor [Pyrinomonadaceae bacterium]|nr:response regulator transcription factor [Pyrinomonadaceae bacterium]